MSSKLPLGILKVKSVFLGNKIDVPFPRNVKDLGKYA